MFFCFMVILVVKLAGHQRLALTPPLKGSRFFFDSLKDALPVTQLINMDESFIAGGKTTSSNKSRIFKMPSFGHCFPIFFSYAFPKLDGSETVGSKSSLFWIHCPTYYNNVSCTTTF